LVKPGSGVARSVPRECALAMPALGRHAGDHLVGRQETARGASMPALASGLPARRWWSLAPIPNLRGIGGGRLGGVGRVLIEASGEVGHLSLELDDDGLELLRHRLKLADTVLQRLTAGAARNGCAHT
jgi:hypothetical protein